MILKYYNRFEMRFTAGNFTRLAKVGNGSLDDINNFAKGVRDAKRFLKRLGLSINCPGYQLIDNPDKNEV